MPMITVEGPFIDLETKRTLVKELTDALEKAYKFPRAVCSVIIKENSPENIGNGGQLVVDRKKQAS